MTGGQHSWWAAAIIKQKSELLVAAIILRTNNVCCNFIVSLSVGDATDSQCSPSQNAAPDGSSSIAQKSGEAPALLAAAGSQPQTTVRSASPTFRALQDMESGVSGVDSQSATRQPLKDGEEIRYHGYTNPHKQSRSFKMLEQGLRMSESGQGVFLF